MGIALASASADASLRLLAAHAASGDKFAQFELGMRFEDGRGVMRDLAKARKLYRLAASPSGGPLWSYVPPAAKGQRGQIMHVDGGPRFAGLKQAKDRLDSLQSGTPIRGAAARPGHATAPRARFALVLAGPALLACAPLGAAGLGPQLASGPVRADLVRALEEIDGELCRRAIDLCETEVNREDYAIASAKCGKPKSGRTNCTIVEGRAPEPVRRCTVMLERAEGNITRNWQVARGTLGGVPRALLANCDFE